MLLEGTKEPCPGCLSYIVARDVARPERDLDTGSHSKESHSASLKSARRCRRAIAKGRPWHRGLWRLRHHRAWRWCRPRTNQRLRLRELRDAALALSPRQPYRARRSTNASGVVHDAVLDACTSRRRRGAGARHRRERTWPVPYITLKFATGFSSSTARSAASLPGSTRADASPRRRAPERR